MYLPHIFKSWSITSYRCGTMSPKFFIVVTSMRFCIILSKYIRFCLWLMVINKFRYFNGSCVFLWFQVLLIRTRDNRFADNVRLFRSALIPDNEGLPGCGFCSLRGFLRGPISSRLHLWQERMRNCQRSRLSRSRRRRLGSLQVSTYSLFS